MQIPIGQINDGPAFSLPLDLVTQTLAILARKGRGKSYLASVVVEGLLDAGQVPVVIDPTGAWWGLKSSADGRQPAYPMVVFGGEHADLPIEETAGEATARAIVEQRFPAIIDLSEMRKGQTKRFVTAFLETLYRLNKLPLMLVVDEADDICPQKPFGDEAQMVGALEDVVKRGRKKGIGCMLITQRPADLAKQVLTQCEMLVAMGLSHPLDIKAVMEWVNVQADRETAKQMVESLPGLAVGQAWFWAPGSKIFCRVSVAKRKTFDSGATPKAGQVTIIPKQMAQADLVKIGGEIMASVQRAKDNDPRELKAKLSRLEGELFDARALDKEHEQAHMDMEKVQPVPIRVDVSVLTNGDQLMLGGISESMHKVREMVEQAEKWLFHLKEQVPLKIEASAANWKRMVAQTQQAEAERPAVARKHEIYRAQMGESGAGGLSRCARMLLTALVQFDGQAISRSKMCFIAGYSPNSSTVRNGLSELRTSDYIIEQGDNLTSTMKGVARIGEFTPFPVGEQAIEFWLTSGKLSKCAATMLESVNRITGKKITRNNLGQLSGYSVGSSTFRNGLSELRVMGLIETDSANVWIHPEFT